MDVRSTRYVVAATLLLLAVGAMQTAQATHEGKLHYRPCDTVYGTPQDIPVAVNWTESYDDGDVFYCLTDQNDTDSLDTGYLGNDTMFIQQRVYYDSWTDEYHKMRNVDFHVSNVNYSQDKSIGHNTDGVYIEFDYYIPSGDVDQDGTSNNVCYEDVEQYVLVGNENANFSEGSGTFDDAFYELNNTESQCDQWHHFRHHVNDFTNDFGSAFSHSSKTIGAFSLEAGNMYVKNAKIVGMNGANVYRIW